ncbi:hypothetical protein TorRG33x02_187760 [Trema orientale]|uniref:Uncharacterized protein n=1 Tax=Trema orientale TaxID=63057 RepID=A0A2P5EIK4_TREOI|nr:hypothetical protein TorRG33x02_187760 [Trema orientale]
MRRPMFGVGALNWYPNRNPSEEINRTTGRSRFRSGRATESDDVVWIVVLGVEKKRKAKAPAAERATHVTRRREMKTTVVAVDFLEESDEDVESVLKERRAVVGLGGSSS